MCVCVGGCHSLPTHWPTVALCPQERLPTVPLSGMFNKSGGKVRLTFKLEQDQLWIGTKGRLKNPEHWQSKQLCGDSHVFLFFSTERTEKVPMGSIKNVVSEPIEGHEGYHMMVTVLIQKYLDLKYLWWNLTVPARGLILLLVPLQAFQLGPTEASQYWVYWVPAQFVDAIKDTVLGKWQYF